MNSNAHNNRIVKREDEIEKLVAEVAQVRKEMHDMRHDFTREIGELRQSIFDKLNEMAHKERTW